MKTPHARGRRQHGRAKALTAALISTALIASTFIATASQADPASAAGAASGTVRGTVFQNYVSTGWSAAPAAGHPVSGVTATAYDVQGDIVGSGVSAADGGYSITIEDAYSRNLRVEFSGWEAGFEPAFAAQGTAPNGVLDANDTSVQFVTLDAAASANDVDFGLIDPDQVTQANAPIATAVQSAGALKAVGSTNLPAIVAQPWVLDGEDPSSSKISTVTKFGDIGAVWGMAYDQQSNDLFAAASLKRMSALGTLGIGGIYRTQDILSANGSVKANAAAQGWLDFAGLAVSNDQNAPLNIGQSLAPTTEQRRLAAANTPRSDIGAFQQAGRIGIGGLATSPDGSRLFATNLYDGQVYAVDISNSQVAPTSTYRIDTPVRATQAIWAVQVHEGRLYIGYVDTGDTAAGADDPGKSAALKGMKAYVASTPIVGVMDAVAPAAAWTTDLTIDLGYAKGSNIKNWTAKSGNKFEAEFPQLTRWNSWTNDWKWGSGATSGTVAMKGATVGVDLHAYPQAILSSIAFDVDGYLNVGFLDRTSVQSGNRSYGAVLNNTDLWTTISNGDVLVAAPAARWEAAGAGCPATVSEAFVLECKGKVGDRAVRTTTTTTAPIGQNPTYNNSQGPGGGEFFNDRRELGTETGAGLENHNEIALGSVTSYPGSREVATTAMDPRSTAYRTGLMWFDERTGAASRGIDLVARGDVIGSTSFQKSGGLGGTALLAVNAPVEIGNRVWLDADLNGRQDADEPAINGAAVQLWTADANGQPVDKIATRTTATIDGQPGTYYFRTDDPDVVAATNTHPFVANASYVLVFPAGSGAVALAGPNAGNAGFAGLAWSDLQRTTSEVRVAPTASNGGTTALNDSNPAVGTGYAAITVGAPGKNDHTYDAGWTSANNYVLSKAFNPSTAAIPVDASYTFNVVSATNFRGEDRLASGGSGVPGDPQVNDVEMTLTSGNWTRTSTDVLPLGYQLVLEEKNAAAGSVTWSTPVAGNTARGQVTITPKRGAQESAQLTATNHIGSFAVVKTVVGSAAATVSENVKFKLEYTLNGGAVQEGWVTKKTPFDSGPIPINTTVKVRESNPIVTDPVVEGITWGTPAWAQVKGVTGPDADGWYSFDVTAVAPTLTLGLTNRAEPTKGSFSILKARAAGELLPNQKFSFQYKVGSAGTPVALGPIAAGDTASTADTILYGSTVFVREIAPLDVSTVKWAAPVWSGLPTGAVGPDANGWYSFTFKPNQAAPLVLTATNQALPQYGQFNVTKTVEVTGNPDVADKVFTFWYRTAPPVDGTTPVFGAETAFELSADETWNGPGPLLVGTLVQVREEALVDEPGISWRTPSWTLNNSSATVVDGRAQFTITPLQAGTAQAIVAKNHSEELHGLTLRKAFIGTGVQEVDDLDYAVEVQIGAGAIEQIALSGSGDAWQGPTDLLEGTTVKVRELELPDVPGIDWGAPSWADGAGTVLPQDTDGWVVFTIGDGSTSASLTLTNTPSLLGQFQVKKTLTTSGDPTVPVNYTVHYKRDGVPQASIVLQAEQLSAVIGDLPLGTTITVREEAPAPQAGVAWALPAWKINGAAAIPDADGWVTFTIDDKTLVVLEVKNSATELFGGFQVAKKVSGDGASLVPADTKFWFSYTLGGGEPQSVSATPATMSDVIGGLAHGTEVTIEEVAFPDIPGVAFNPNPGWKLNGVDVDFPVTFTIDAAQQQVVELSVDNNATPEYGTFGLTKEITGDAADRIPEDASFTVEYSVDNGTTWLALPAITKQNLTITSGDFLVGTHILLREVAPADGVGFTWGTPIFSIGGVAQGTSAQFTIAKPERPAVSVTLNNPAVPRNGTFDVEKRVTGGFALSDPEFAGLTFTANWSGGGRSGSIALNASNSWKNGPDGAKFPEGTTITLTEAAVTGLPAHVRFDGYNWLAGVTGVTVSPDGKNATLTVASGDPTHLVLVNSFTPLKGTFSVKKVVDGDFKLDDPELKGLTFTVKYTASNGQTGSLRLNSDGDWKAAAGRLFPKGTTVTLIEVAVDQSSLSPHVQWDGYTWVPNDSYLVSSDGLSASLVIGDQTDVALTLRNSFSPLTGSFAVQKIVKGSFELSDSELRAQTFTAAYTTSTGQSGTLDLTAQNGWSAVAGELPAGTKVTLTEVVPTKLAANVSWDDHRWMPTDGVTISTDGKTASLIVRADTPVIRLALENTFSPLEGSFSVKKVVEGDFDLTSPELSGLTFTAPFTASNGTAGSLTLNEAGRWEAAPGKEFPVGTEITVTEADVSGLPSHVRWDGYTWLDGDGYTVSEDGATASFSITDELVQPKLTLQNIFSPLVGGFTLTKKVTGDAAERVPGALMFTAEFSLDGGESWATLPAMSKSRPLVQGPADVPVGTTVLIRELRPAEIDGVTWGTPAFSGVGITPGANGSPASFVVGSTVEPVNVILVNPTTPSNGQFQVTKRITGAGESLLKGSPRFTVKYSYDGQESPGKFTIKAGEVVSSEPIATGTVVTITEIVPHDGVVDGASWGTPVFVRPDGTVLENGATITIGSETVIALQLENPTVSPLASTGTGLVGAILTLVALLGGAGLVLLHIGRRRRFGQLRS